jgi:hypothetical protein
VADSTHLQGRLAVRDGSHRPRIGLDETTTAIALEGHIRDGDLGSARRLLHEAEYHLGPFRPDPWALLEHLAVLAVTRQAEAAEAPGPDDGSTSTG